MAIGLKYEIIEDILAEPIDVDFFKSHARIDFDTDDSLSLAYIKSARQHLENWAQLSFGVRTMKVRALWLPENYKLMFGPVNTVITEGFTNFGDLLKGTEGKTDIEVTYTTTGLSNEVVKVAIARYAAGLYISRENVVDTKFSTQLLQDEAKKMIRSLANITIC